jgi:prolyl-tRNA synthetase
MQIVTDWAQFVPTLNDKNMILAPWCEETKCEEDIKANSARQYGGARMHARTHTRTRRTC